LYSTFKAIFLLYLALPQTQGATYIYIVHLRPFFATHEKQIDMAIAEVRGRAYRFIQEKARALWAAMVGALAPGGDSGAQGMNAANPAQPPPSTAPGSGPTQLISSLWTSYGPGIIAGGAALLRQTAAATLPTGPDAQKANAFNTPSNSMFFNPSVDPLERRKQLEAELAALPSVPFPSANNPARPSVSSSSSSSSTGLRERTMSGKFEEIKGGDVEGYDLDEDFVGGFAVGVDKGVEEPRASGWFSGWGGGSSRGNYQRVKSE